MFRAMVKRLLAGAAVLLAGVPAVAQEVAAPPVVALPPVAGPMEGDVPPPAAGPQATLSGMPFAGGCSSCGTDCASGPVGCGEGGCYPGRDACAPIEGRTRVGRLLAAYQNALCCPDPCYQPKWVCGANAALFVDHARPTTMTRIRWDRGLNLTDPDRAEFFWAQIGGPGPAQPETSVDYNELHLYQEVGADKFSVFVDLAYRNFNGQANGGRGGIGDLQVGTKSLLLDSELVQFTFQFVTHIPTAGPGGGIGTGHVSLDPSLVTAVKLSEKWYTQGQLGYWFGVGNSTGSLIHYRNSLNRVLWSPTCDTQLIGTFEGVGYSFTSGQVTLPNGALVAGNDTTYYTVGPGVRYCICNKIDFGFGVQFAVTDRHFAQTLYRTELRIRF